MLIDCLGVQNSSKNFQLKCYEVLNGTSVENLRTQLKLIATFVIALLKS
jgi:hypothetical protein